MGCARALRKPGCQDQRPPEIRISLQEWALSLVNNVQTLVQNTAVTVIKNPPGLWCGYGGILELGRGIQAASCVGEVT